MVNASAFEKGGTLILKSFKPGPGAAADDDTDQLSLMMIKGIKDTLSQKTTQFAVQAEDQEGSDFYLGGHIEDYGREGHFSHLKLRSKR